MEISALEFFSGIGGMHYGLKDSECQGDVIAAFDISPLANACYKHNFGVDPIQVGIDNLSVKKIAAFQANCWLMSPPCQPYTRLGKMMDSEDPRAKGFLHLILLLRTMDTPPEYLFVENVCNFEKSMTRQTLVDALRELHYEFEEWILSPTQFGIPNERPRYYLIARRVFSGTVNNTTLYDSAPPRTDWKGRMFSPNPIPVSSFLDKAVDFEALAIPPSFLKTRSWLSSVVIAKPEELTTCCFTKAYGHHGLRAGSFLQTAEIQDYDSDLLDSPEEAAKVLSLRMFSPDEVARLHHFPIGKEFTFPPTLSTQQRWKVIGNSMNVFVVGSLLKRLFTEREWM